MTPELAPSLHTHVHILVCIPERKRKGKGSLVESQLCWMVFCWGKHMKEGFPEVDTGERLRQTPEGMCH